MLTQFKQIRMSIMTSILTGVLASAVAANQPSSPKAVAEPIDPARIDLTQPTLFIVPYTHLDDIWRWDYPDGVRYFIRNTLDENFESFQKYPHFKFNWTGAARYEQMKEYYPKRYEELKEWIAVNRWFPVGNAWVEADVNVSSSESIMRQVLAGHSYFKSEFDRESNEFMLPDCFGFPYSLPSILSHCGLRGFSTQKLTWESANGIPFDVGKWMGPDGNWVIAALNGGNYAGEHPENYSKNEEMLKRLQENGEKSGLPIHWIYMGGGDRNNADRGGTPRVASLENIENNVQHPGPVNVVVDRAGLMFEAITDQQAEKFPTWDSDLLLIKHSTGVLTSQAYTKQINHDAELLINAAERAAVTAAYLSRVAYPTRQLADAWKLVLRNQFHDILPGTSIPAAQAKTWNDGIIALNQSQGVYTDAIGSLATSLNTSGTGVPLVIHNPLSMDRDDVVEAMIPESLKNAGTLTAYNAEGEAQPTQLTTAWDGTRRVLFRAKVPSVGAAVYYLRDEPPPVPEKSPFKLNQMETMTEIENERYKVIINHDGDIASIFDKQVKRELLGKPAQLQFIPNFPDRKPAWRIYPDDIAKPPRSVASDPMDIRMVEHGPVRAAIEVVRFAENSKIVQRIRLYSGTDANRVEVANHIDWRTRGALFKAAFDLTASNPKATYNLELGTIERGNRTEKQYEVPTHGWIDLTDTTDEFGVTLLTEHKYGSDKPDDHTLRLTLIHSPDTEPWEDETRDNGRTREMRWQDWGRHEFNYAITSHKGHWSNANPTREALRFEQPLTAFEVPEGEADKSALSFMQVSSPQVNIQAVKMAENGSGVIVRLQEVHGKPCSDLVLSAALPFTMAEETDGIERPLKINIPVKDQSISLDFSRFECKSILLKLPAPRAQNLTKPLELEYDCDIFSTNEMREDGYDQRRVLKDRGDETGGASGSLDGKGNTYPAEMMGDTVQVGNVTFNIGPRDPYMANAVACRGQTIDVPEGPSVIHLLAAADKDTDVVFQAGGTDIPVTIGGWTGCIGQWDDRVFIGDVAKISYSLRNDLERIAPAYVRNERIAWYASHRHMPYQDTYYDYGYLFAYRLEIPKGVRKLTLPQAPFVRIVAMSAGDEHHAVALQNPFADLHRDAEFDARFGMLNIPEVNADRRDAKSK